MRCSKCATENPADRKFRGECSCINRLGETLALNTKEMLVLANPETKRIIEDSETLGIGRLE